MVLSMERWRGQVAVVTGASSGIGAETVKMLLKHGLIVVGLARRVNLIEEYRKELPSEDIQRLYAIKCDMRNECEIVEAFSWTLQHLGPVAVLINNAGTSAVTSLSDGDADLWRSVLDVNVMGVCIATREAIQHMKAHNIDGHIIHISSVLGHYVAFVPGINMYSPSKHAVRALVEALRQELLKSGTRIRISSVSPGPVDTEFLKDIEAANFPKLLADDVSDAVEYVLSTPPHVQVQDVMVRPLGEPV